jgi:hypothetical protein
MNFLAVEGKDVKEDMKSCQISTIMKVLSYIVWLQNGKTSQFWLYEQYYWNNQSNFIQSAHIEIFNLCNI